MRTLSCCALVARFGWSSALAGSDIYTDDSVDSLSLLQLKAHSSFNESPLPSMSSAYYSSGYQGLCMLFKDAHVKSTFFRGNPRKDVDLADFDDFRVQGTVPLAKSSDGTLEAQGFNCPLANPRLHVPTSQRTALQSWALKVGDDVIEYYNNDYNTAPMDRLQGLFKVNLGDWKSAVDSVCPPGTGAKLSSFPDGKDWDYYAYERHKSVAWLKSDIWLRVVEQKAFVNDPCYEGLKALISGGEPMLGVNGNPLPTNFLRDQVTGPIPGLPDVTIRFHGKESFQIFNAARDWVIMANFWDKAPKFGLSRGGTGNFGWQQPMVTWNLRLAPNLKPVAPDDTLCGSTPPNNYPTTQLVAPDVLFSIAAQNANCAWCNWLPSNANYPRTDGVTFEAMPSCVPQTPPPTPAPPPPVSELCETEGISMEKAQTACESFQENSIFWRDCLVDYCASGGDPDTASEELHELAIDTTTTTPAPPAVDACPCTNSASFSLNTPQYSNLGGAGPDSGPSGILYAQAGLVGGRAVDVKVSASSPYKGKGSKNGVVGSLGRLNVKAGKSVGLDFQILDSATGEAVSLDGLSLTFLDLDEGKNGQGRASVTVCGAQQFVANPSELTLMTDSAGVCSTASSSVAGTSTDNPSSVEAALTSDVASKRIASYVFGAGTTFSVTLDVAKGYGYRNFMFALEPGAACSDDSNLPTACVAAMAEE